MFHGAHVILGDRVRHVADEKVLNRVTIGEQGAAFGKTVFHKTPFVVLSHTDSHLRAFTHQSQGSCYHTPLRIFVFLPTATHSIWLRVFTHQDSCLYPLSFVFLHTRGFVFILFFSQLDQTKGLLTQESNYI